MLIASNTLLITNLSPQDFSIDGINIYKTTLSSFGDIKYLVPFKALNRLVVVYSSTMEAISAKDNLTSNTIYFGQETDLDAITMDYLKVPEIEKNFLLSPPGSPPIDWIQSRESHPYRGGHTQAIDDMEVISLDNETLGKQSLDDLTSVPGGSRIVLDFNDPNSSSSLPMIVVDNYDGDDLQDNWMGGGDLKTKKGTVFQQTRLPDIAGLKL